MAGVVVGKGLGRRSLEKEREGKDRKEITRGGEGRWKIGIWRHLVFCDNHS